MYTILISYLCTHNTVTVTNGCLIFVITKLICPTIPFRDCTRRLAFRVRTAVLEEVAERHECPNATMPAFILACARGCGQDVVVRVQRGSNRERRGHFRRNKARRLC